MKKTLSILFAVSIVFTACEKEEEITTPTVINGCMDAIATNYDSTATNDDGTCMFSIVGTWSPTSAAVDYSVTMAGVTLMDTSYTTTPSDPDFEFTDIIFTADGNVTMDGETSTYTDSGSALTITESDGESQTVSYTVTSTEMVIIINETETEDENGMTLISTSNITMNYTRQ